MAFKQTGSLIGLQPITETSTTQRHQIGTITTAYDEVTYKYGEFIYLKGINSTIVGSIVNYDDSFLTALDTGAVTGPSRALAVAMSACPTSSFGWYQISGMALMAKANTVSFADGAGLGSASGLAVAVATGTIIQNAVVFAVASAKSDVTTVKVAINRPHTTTDVS